MRLLSPAGRSHIILSERPSCQGAGVHRSCGQSQRLAFDSQGSSPVPFTSGGVVTSLVLRLGCPLFLVNLEAAFVEIRRRGGWSRVPAPSWTERKVARFSCVTSRDTALVWTGITRTPDRYQQPGTPHHRAQQHPLLSLRGRLRPLLSTLLSRPLGKGHHQPFRAHSETTRVTRLAPPFRLILSPRIHSLMLVGQILAARQSPESPAPRTDP